MTTTTTAPVPPGVRKRSSVGWADLAWVSWRQHRWLIGFTAVLAIASAAYMLALAVQAGEPGSGRNRVWLLDMSVYSAGHLMIGVPIAFGAFVAVFWAAPMLSREYEQRTHLVVWSQDVPAGRWLLGKVVLLGAVLVALAAALGGAANVMVHRMVDAAVSNEYSPFRLFRPEAFESVPHVQIGYVLFGFALGLAVSAITRRTVLSMGITFGVYFVVRATFATYFRGYYQTPVRIEADLDQRGVALDSVLGDRGAWAPLYVDGGYLDSAGNTMGYPRACMGSFDSADGYDKCLRDNGIVKSYNDFQPIERLATFQFIEFAIFTVLAVGLFALAWVMVRRAHRV